MTFETLGAPVVTGAALRSVNFFNGRLLTGEDLRGEQINQEARLARLARACGDGIGHGFEVAETFGSSTPQQPVVTVEAGLALSPSGLALELSAAVDLALARPAPVAGGEPDGLFADCQPHAPGTYTAGSGVYLLAVGPATRGEGRAPVSGLGNQGAPCNIAVSVEAVRFRLIRLAIPPAELLDRPHLRNRVAYRCFGGAPMAAFVRDPFRPRDRATLIDDLRAQTLGPDEVPLAILGWSTADGIHFVDRWAVRRRVARGAWNRELPLAAGDRRLAEAEAMIRQFQEHLEDVRVAHASSSLVAANHFEWLPPVGLLPLGGGAGFDFGHFFTGLPLRDPAVLEGSRVAELYDHARSFPPIQIARGEAIWLYLVRENVQPVAGAAVAPHRYLIFTSGHVPYRADARFELAYWNFANYAEVD